MAADGNGKLSTRRKTFEDMAKGRPQLEGLRQLRHARDKMRKIKLAVGADGRNRTVLWPYKAKTSRTQPKASQWIFSPAVWLRSLIKPAVNMSVAYVDWSSMEFLIAAALSEDPMMLEFYRTATRTCPLPSGSARRQARPLNNTHEPLRDRYKTGLLAIQYGVRAETLGARLGVSTFDAHEMINQHHELFAVYWRWSDDWLAHALDTGVMWTPLGWICRTGITEFNERSVRNFPIQGSGAYILRVACIWATRHGLRLLGPVHDAVLIEAPLERIDVDVTLMQELMRRASRVVLGIHELRTDAKIIRHPNRYTDRRGDAVWANVLQLLAEYRQREEPCETARQAN